MAKVSIPGLRERALSLSSLNLTYRKVGTTRWVEVASILPNLYPDLSRSKLPGEIHQQMGSRTTDEWKQALTVADEVPDAFTLLYGCHRVELAVEWQSLLPSKVWTPQSWVTLSAIEERGQGRTALAREERATVLMGRLL